MFKLQFFYCSHYASHLTYDRRYASGLQGNPDLTCNSHKSQSYENLHRYCENGQVNGEHPSSFRSTASSRCQSRVAPSSNTFSLTILPHRERWGYSSYVFHKKRMLSPSLCFYPEAKPRMSSGAARRLELIMVKARIRRWRREQWNVRSTSEYRKSWAVPKLTGKAIPHRRGIEEVARGKESVERRLEGPSSCFGWNYPSTTLSWGTTIDMWGL